jgi:hypothetical protein
MWILPALGYVGVVLGFAFLTLAIGKSFKYYSAYSMHELYLLV